MRTGINQGRGMTLSLPPFTPAIIWIIGVNAGVFLFVALVWDPAPHIIRFIRDYLALTPSAVLHGMLWQLLTYGFLHFGFGHFFWNMFGLWMFGSAIEGGWGTKRFMELYLAGILGAGIFSVLLSFAGPFASDIPTIGASGGLYAVLMAFGIVYAENEIIMFPFPFRLKAKYFVAILIFVTIVFSLQGGGGVAHLAHLGGLLTGYLYVRFAPARGFRGIGADPRGWWLDVKASYYKWKRRRAARKFEVYMRKHDRSVYFDEYGNYRGPEAEPPKDKEDGEGRPPWVN